MVGKLRSCEECNQGSGASETLKSVGFAYIPFEKQQNRQTITARCKRSSHDLDMYNIYWYTNISLYLKLYKGWGGLRPLNNSEHFRPRGHGPFLYAWKAENQKLYKSVRYLRLSLSLSFLLWIYNSIAPQIVPQALQPSRKILEAPNTMIDRQRSTNLFVIVQLL